MSTRTAVPTARCRCGHGVDAHEHFRSGTDCASCGPDVCRRYTARTGTGLPARVRLPAQSVVVPGLAWNRLRRT